MPVTTLRLYPRTLSRLLYSHRVSVSVFIGCFCETLLLLIDVSASEWTRNKYEFRRYLNFNSKNIVNIELKGNFVSLSFFHEYLQTIIFHESIIRTFRLSLCDLSTCSISSDSIFNISELSGRAFQLLRFFHPALLFFFHFRALSLSLFFHSWAHIGFLFSSFVRNFQSFFFSLLLLVSRNTDT